MGLLLPTKHKCIILTAMEVHPSYYGGDHPGYPGGRSPCDGQTGEGSCGLLW